MRIATFNANSIRSRLDVILDWLRASNTDVLCIQETKVQDPDFPETPIRDAGYHVAYRGQKSYNGVALISRTPCDTVRFGLDDDGPADEPRLLHARFGPLHLVNTYVPQGREIAHEMYAYKLEWFARLKRYFDRHCRTDQPVLWTGDLNVAAEPEDVHSPDTKKDHVCFHEDVRRAFADTRDWGFTDLYRAKHPDDTTFTFYDYRTPNAAKRAMGWRIDYLLASPPLADRCRAVEVDLEPRLKPKPSDHTFLYADFENA